MKKIKTWLITALLTLSALASKAQQDSILLFVSYDQTYYTEYIVMYKALTASGYFVDVRSAANGYATTYMVGNFSAQGYTNYYQSFKDQYLAMFGTPWVDADTLFPNPGIPLHGSINDLQNMAAYKAMVIAGGTGSIDYRIDGSYPSQRELPSGTIRASAEKLNQLAEEALESGKPVIAQCHGASLPAFWRVSGTNGQGFDNLGISILAGQQATGFPDGNTPIYMNDLGITYLANDPVVLTSPTSSFEDFGNGQNRLGTSRDWHPYTVAHTAKTLVNVLRTYPGNDLKDTVSVLLVHGGITNCAGGDIPCNHGMTGESIPADYINLDSLLNANSPFDDFVFQVSDVNLIVNAGNGYAFNQNNECEIIKYLAQYDVIVFFKHWATQVSNPFKSALVKYADYGGGVVSLHHGLFDTDKNGIVDTLFQAVSALAGWGANLTNINYFNTNYGHFTTTYGINYTHVASAPGVWGVSNPLKSGSNLSLGNYKYFTVFDELYSNMQFHPSASFGTGINQITPLFSNGNAAFNPSFSPHQHVQGYTKMFSSNPADGSIGKIVFAQSGERKANFRLPNPYAQFIRNAIYWAGSKVEIDYPDKNWIANSGGAWTGGINWEGGSMPTPCHDVIIDKEMPVEVQLPQNNVLEVNSLYLGALNSLLIPSNTVLNITHQ